MLSVERFADELGIKDRLHLWPDKALLKHVDDPAWLHSRWARISEWPR
jgi:hypothetical protein